MEKYTKYTKWLLIILLFGIFLLPQSGYCRNIQTPWGMLDVHGFISQETSWGIGSTHDFHNISDLFTIQLETGFTPSGILGQYVSFYGILRFRADWAYSINRGSGWWDKGGDGLKGSYSFHKREHLHEYSWAYGRNRDEDLPREIYADIYLGNWQFRIGKQQVVWGESDGIRLMDCINPQDLQFQGWFYDSDEGYESSRIPLWLIKAEYFFPHEWFNGLIRDQSVEFIINPGDNEVDRFNIAGGWRGVPAGRYEYDRAAGIVRFVGGRQKYVTTHGDYANQGGPWAFLFPWLPQFSQVWPHDSKKRGHMEFAVRFKFNIHDWYITLNGFYGYQRFYMLKWRGFTFRPAYRNGQLNVRPDELDALVKLGQFMQANGKGSLTTNIPGVGPVPTRLLNDFLNGGYPLSAKYTHAWGGYTDPYMNPHIMQLDVDWYYPRMQLVGFTVNKSMWWFRWRNTSPVLRVEAVYEFSKTYDADRHHHLVFNPRTGFEGLEWSGFPEYLNYVLGYTDHPFDGFAERGNVRKDELRYMIGYDWPIWIYWLNPHQNFFTSFQFFHFRIINYHDEALVRAPMVFNRRVVNVSLIQFANDPNILNKYIDPWKIPRDRFYITYLVEGKYDHQRIKPKILYVHDLNEDCFWIKAKVNFEYGDKWREEIGWLGIFADEDADFHGTGKSFGILSHNDQIWFKITRQFN